MNEAKRHGASELILGALFGVMFGVGLALAGMTQPAKIFGFLDVAGAWDASLAVVMASALLVYGSAYRLLFLRKLPDLQLRGFVLPRGHVDARLLLGAAIFGVGWGLGGFCPGPALTSLASGAAEAGVFVLAMLAGMLAFHFYERLRTQRIMHQGSSDE